MATAPKGAEEPPKGLRDSIRSFLATWVSLLRNRVEIISLEVEEQREWLERQLILAVASLFFLSLGLLLLTSFIVVCCWDSRTIRLAVLGGFALLYLGVGSWAVLVMRRRAKAKPKIFATTVSELDKDEQSLTGQKPPP